MDNKDNDVQKSVVHMEKHETLVKCWAIQL